MLSRWWRCFFSSIFCFVSISIWYLLVSFFYIFVCIKSRCTALMIRTHRICKCSWCNDDEEENQRQMVWLCVENVVISSFRLLKPSELIFSNCNTLKWVCVSVSANMRIIMQCICIAQTHVHTETNLLNCVEFCIECWLWLLILWLSTRP